MKPRRSQIPPRPAPTVNGRRLTPGQEATLRAASQDAAASAVALRARAAARLRALEDQLARDLAEAEVRDGLTDSLGLARARGEAVEQGRQRIRIVSRDGLETLARSGALTANQFKAGMLYRDLYESADPERDLRSQMSSAAFVGGGVSTGPSVAAETRAERRLRLAGALSAIEAKVRVADRNHRAVRALREVAGHARCLSHFVKGGGGQAAYREALVLALEVVAGHFGLG